MLPPLLPPRRPPGSCWGGLPITESGGTQEPPAGRWASAGSSSDPRTSRRPEPALPAGVTGLSHISSAAPPALPAAGSPDHSPPRARVPTLCPVEGRGQETARKPRISHKRRVRNARAQVPRCPGADLSASGPAPPGSSLLARTGVRLAHPAPGGQAGGGRGGRLRGRPTVPGGSPGPGPGGSARTARDSKRLWNRSGVKGLTLAQSLRPGPCCPFRKHTRHAAPCLSPAPCGVPVRTGTRPPWLASPAAAAAACGGRLRGPQPGVRPGPFARGPRCRRETGTNWAVK